MRSRAADVRALGDMPTNEAARLLRVSVRTVQRHRPPVQPHKRWTPEEVARVQQMLDDGVPQVDIAETLGRTVNSVRWKFPRSSPLTPAERARVRWMRYELAKVGKR